MIIDLSKSMKRLRKQWKTLISTFWDQRNKKDKARKGTETELYKNYCIEGSKQVKIENKKI